MGKKVFMVRSLSTCNDDDDDDDDDDGVLKSSSVNKKVLKTPLSCR